ncbi:MAG: cyclic nucleotide-binding domain-containing protein [Alphaproteobacteria bacterium]|nr:cyclic nucleotide-binding domain-containing protein [Alphaproteobacteria bacterium]
MSLKDELEVIKRIPLFSKVDPAHLKLLAFASERLTFGDGEYLFHQGDDGDSAYILLEGEAEVLAGANEAVVARLGPNDLVGEIGMICNKPRSASVRALGTMTALMIPKDVFMPMLTEFPGMAQEITIELAARLERTTQQLVERTSENAE